MDYTLQTLLQNVSDPLDLADSISAFIESRTSMYGPTLEKLSGVIEGEVTADEFYNDNSIMHRFVTNIGDSSNDMQYISLNEITVIIEEGIEDEDASMYASIRSIGGGEVERIPMTEALDRFREMGAQSDMLATSMRIISQYIDERTSDNTSDFLLTSFAKIEGYLTESGLSSRLKTIFTLMSEELADQVNDPVSLITSCLAHFGFAANSDDPRKNDVSMYTGQSARNTLLTQACEKIGWAVGQIPNAYQFILGIGATIMYGLEALVNAAYKGLQSLTEIAIAKVFELDDGIQKTSIPGRGYIQHPGFAIKFDGSHTSFPSGEAMGNVFTAISTALGTTSSKSQQFTIPVGPMVLYLNWLVDSAEITYDVRPVDYQVYQQVFIEHFGSAPKLFIKAAGGTAIEADSSGINLEGLSRVQLIKFLNDLYSRNKLWGMDYKFDAQRYMCIQASRHLLAILIALSDSSVTVIDSTLASELDDNWLYIDITQEYGYNSTAHAFIPENINFASICTYMGYRAARVDCFNGNLSDNNVLDLTDNTGYPYYVSLNLEPMAQLGQLIAYVIGNDPASTGNYFVPYFHRFKKYRPSFYIPTDSDNLSLLKRMIVTGVAVIGTIAVAVTAIYLGSKFKKKKWMLEQQAAQKAFDASANNNAALLSEGWKLQKRVNLMGAISGTTEMMVTPITTGVSAIYSSIKLGTGVGDNASLAGILQSTSDIKVGTSSSDEVSIEGVLRAIKG